MNINDHRDDIAEALNLSPLSCTCGAGSHEFCGKCIANHLLASPALARLLAAARDEARAEGNPCRSGCALMTEALGDWDGAA